VRLKESVSVIVVHDSGDDLSGCNKHVQFCRWHMSHRFGHYLWQDWITHKNRGVIRITSKRFSEPVKTESKVMISLLKTLKESD